MIAPGTLSSSPSHSPSFMEAVSPPGLTWVTEPIPDCLACNGAVEPEEANLAVAGADDSPDARCRH